MEHLPEFDLVQPGTLDELLAAAARPGARLLGGGTDLMVNIRRGIGDPPPSLVDVNGVAEIRGIDVDGDTLRVGSGVRIADLAAHPEVGERFPGIAQAAASVAGPTQRHMGTVGGNLCLDTRCIYYNQSAWWRAANDYCIKYQGELCHVATKSKRCYATYSGDLAPAFLVLQGEVEIAGPAGLRTAPLTDLYTGDGQHYLTLEPGEIVVAARARTAPGLRTAYDKIRVRRSIDYPIAGVAAAVAVEDGALATLRIAFTGTNPRPLLLEGTEDFLGKPLDAGAVEELEGMMRRQVMAMKTTFTSGHYRRRVAGVLALRLGRALEAA
jgi:4-hydroxybenzoyl-CoA reductase subunit beta